MGDHFWPAVYPGLAVGVIFGLYAGGLVNVVLGAIGGIAAAFISLAYFNAFFSQEGLFPLVILLGLSLMGAACLIQIGKLMAPRSRLKDPN